MRLALAFPAFFCFSLLAIASISANQFAIDGKVIELDDSNFDSAISSFDFLLVDFYAPWCGHCKRLSPELDAAAPVLAELKTPIVIAKLNADKYTSLARKYEIDGFPTLKIFMHGVPTDYYGPRKAELLVRFLKKFVAPDVAVLDSDSAVSEFVEAAGTFFPIYIGFGMNATDIAELAIKYKRKAWFSVAKDFSDSIMEFYDFHKAPALVSIHPTYNDRNVFYGPAGEKYLEDFVKQNLFPLCVPINSETLKSLKEDTRKIVLTLVEDENDEKTKELIKLLKAAASANRDFIFGYVGLKQWQEFVETFEIDKKTTLPRMVVWDGNEEYLSVIGFESIGEEDQASQITAFVEGFKAGRTLSKKIAGPSLMSFINSLIGLKLVFIIVFVVAVIMLIQTIGKVDDEHPGATTRRAREPASSMSSKSELLHSGEKED